MKKLAAGVFLGATAMVVGAAIAVARALGMFKE